jgi:hypothetical protein
LSEVRRSLLNEQRFFQRRKGLLGKCPFSFVRAVIASDPDREGEAISFFKGVDCFALRGRLAMTIKLTPPRPSELQSSVR